MNFRLKVVKNALRYYKMVGQHAFIHPQLARVAFETLAIFLPGKLKGVKYNSFKIGAMDAEWIEPENCARNKVLLFFHGGGFATGSLETHRALISWIATYAEVKAVSIDYRLAPEHQYPSQLEDAVAAYKYLLRKKYLPENIVFGGESAGANLAASTLIYLRDNEIPLPTSAVLLSPWLDMTASGKSCEKNHHIDPMVPYHGIKLWAKNYAGNASLTNPLVSPLFANLQGLPPIYIQVGECEVLLDDATRFAKKAKKAGVDVRLEVWPHLFHAWQGFWMILPEGVAANKKLGTYLKEKLSAKAVSKKLAKAA
jgi:acetyl esterase/lipase